jgi:hypothetical protein
VVVQFLVLFCYLDRLVKRKQTVVIYYRSYHFRFFDVYQNDPFESPPAYSSASLSSSLQRAPVLPSLKAMSDLFAFECISKKASLLEQYWILQQ